MDLLGSARCRKGKQQVIRWIILFEAKSRKKNIFWVHEDRDEVAGADQNNKWGHGKGWWPRACQLATWGSFCRPGRMTGHWPNSRALLSLIKVGEERGAAVIIFILLVSSSTASTALLSSSLITFSNFPKFCLQGLLGIPPCCHRSGTLSVTVSGQFSYRPFVFVYDQGGECPHQIWIWCNIVGFLLFFCCYKGLSSFLMHFWGLSLPICMVERMCGLGYLRFWQCLKCCTNGILMWLWKIEARDFCSVALCNFWCILWPRRWVSASVLVACCRFSILLSLRVHVILDAFVGLFYLFAWWKCEGWGRGWVTTLRVWQYVVCGETEVLQWFWNMMERDFLLFPHVSFCYSWFVSLVLPLCMTMMVTVCIISFLKVHVILDAFFCPFLPPCVCEGCDPG